MSNSYGRVVVLGKSKRQAPEELLNILSTIEPTDVPTNLIENIYVILSDKTRYQIDKKQLKNGVDYDQIVSYVKATGAKAPVDTIEIVVDIDYTQRLLKNQIHRILDPYFS